LRRVIQRLVQDRLALLILEGRFREGDRVVVDAAETGELTFRKESRVKEHAAAGE
jgi:ATP-dependent Clp protease ATP-binding subunit ClpB